MFQAKSTILDPEWKLFSWIMEIHNGIPQFFDFHSGTEIVALICLHVIYKYKYENQFQTKTQHHLVFFGHLTNHRG